MYTRNKSSGFVLIELMVVVAIIGLLANIAMTATAESRKKARDTKRISEIRQLRTAVNLYLSIYGQFPQDSSAAGECNGGWDSPADGDFVPELVTAGLLNKDVIDISNYNDNNGNCGNYQYRHYSAGHFGCDPSRGKFYVLQIVDLESTPGFGMFGAGGQYPSSPGYDTSCPAGPSAWDWAEYIIMEYEK